ncbi:MAG: serine O-acetyltransferase, partial [Chloroflexota bacterium]
VFRTLRVIREDLQAVFDRDPAARNVVEVVLAYPGLHAIWLHRFVNRLHRGGVPLLPRLISHFGRWVTGIEIHPGARIGRRLFIDHGMGVVIGETAEIGDDVTLYQGVSLAIYHTQDARRLRGTKRHPTLGNGVTVGVGAKILGAITVGDGAMVAAGAVVTKDVPPYTTVMGVPARPVSVHDPQTGEKRRLAVAQARLADLPDPELELIRCLQDKVVELEARLAALESGNPPDRTPQPAPVLSGRHAASNGVKRPCDDQLERALQSAIAGPEGRSAAS